MISWHDAVKIAREKFSVGERPIALYRWHAYKEGKILGYSEISYADAKNKFNTQNIDVTIINKDEIKKYDQLLHTATQYAYKLWVDELKAKYKDISDGIYEMCFTRAYDRGHADGYDEVAQLMGDEVEYAKAIIQLTTGNEKLNEFC